MNFDEAIKILQLDSDFKVNDLKTNYHKLAKQYHPDKGGTNEQFQKINDAYTFLSKEQGTEQFDFNFMDTLFKSFNQFHFVNVNDFVNLKNVKSFNNVNVFKENKTIKISLEDYFLKETVVPLKTRCLCKGEICLNCAGCGYQTISEVCTNCYGDGIIQNCELCVNGFIEKQTKIKINDLDTPVLVNNYIIKFVLKEPYFYKNGTIYCNFFISLKESLTGFNKEFKDPFGNKFVITVTKIVKENDGYKLKNGIILVFKIKYPKKISEETKNKLKEINF